MFRRSHTILNALLTPGSIGRKENQLKQKKKEEEEKERAVRRVCVLSFISSLISFTVHLHSAPVASSLFLAHNTALVPPYRVLIDTNFINFSLQNKLELVSGMMDCLYAKCGYYRRPFLFHSPLSRRYSVCDGLCDSGTRKAWTALPLSLAVRYCMCAFLPTMLILLLVWLVTPALSAFPVHTLVPMPTIVSYNE
jgi:hypothetical protein